jgi:hypothetical protein
MMNLKGPGMERFWLILRYECGILVGRLMKYAEVLNEDSRLPGRES